jgi:predicted RNA binding protein YcfA (HicA-like mRNA interferase family)
MAKLPLVSGAKAVKAFSKAGWTIARQAESHSIMVRQDSAVTLSIPMHSEIDRGTFAWGSSILLGSPWRSS